MTATPSNAKIQFHFLSEGSNLPNRSELKRFIERIFRQEKKKLGALNYIFCSDQYLLDINKQFLQHDFYTDIITFGLSDPGQPIVGEVYISLDRVRDNANQYTTSIKGELHRVIFHGALHLCGYRDKKPSEQRMMRAMEDKYLTLYFP